jgi:hypothetical protein
VTNRGFLSWKVNDAVQRLGAATTPESKLHWARVLNEARRERGDFDNTRPPCAADYIQPNGASASADSTVVSSEPPLPQDVPSAAGETAATRLEAMRQVINLEGERYD